MKKIILASTSPRRAALLKQLGIPFRSVDSHYKETIDRKLTPDKNARNISFCKALAVAKKYPNCLIIAADTLVAFEGKILGKPYTVPRALKMLRSLSGHTHSVITGLTLLDTSTGKVLTKTATTKIRVRKLSDAEIRAYVKSGETLDKAGAYAVQGLGISIVEKISGDYYNVVGLPLHELVTGLKEFGINVLDSRK